LGDIPLFVLSRRKDTARRPASSSTVSFYGWGGGQVSRPSGRSARDEQAGRYFLRLSDRRIRQCLAALNDNDDALTTAAANAALTGRVG
jgi:hypothetical protein